MRTILHSITAIIVTIMLSSCSFFSDKEVQRWIVNPNGIETAAFSRDGRFVLTYSKEQHLVLWDLVDNKQLVDLGQQDDKNSPISLIRWSDNGRYAITTTSNNFAVWDLAWSQSVGLWSISDGQIISADLANDGKQVLLGLSNKKAIYINLATGRRLEFLAHQEKVNAVAISANGRFALSGGDDNCAYVWNTQSGEIQRILQHKQNINQVALQRDGLQAFTSDIAEGHFVWDLTTGQILSKLDTSNKVNEFSSARFSDDGKRLITGTQEGKLTLWNTQDGKELQSWNTLPLKNTIEPIATIYDAAFDQHQRVLSANVSGVIQAWMIKP